MIDEQPLPGGLIVRPARVDPQRQEAGRVVSRRRPAVLFLVGLALATCGVVLARSDLTFSFLEPDTQTALIAFFDAFTRYDNFGRGVFHPPALLLGGLLAIVGAALAGWVGRGAVTDTLARASLSFPSLRRDRPAFGAIVLAALCYGLMLSRLLGKQLYTHWDFALFAGAIALLGFAVHRLDSPTRVASTWRLTRLDLTVMLGLVVFTVAINSIELTHWGFAWAGDEVDFFLAAQALAEGRGDSIFSLSGVYGVHPIMDSYLQSVGLVLFGHNITGWRAAEIMVLAAGSILVYMLGTALMGHLPALVAGALLASNNYLMAFSRIGYNNTHVVLYTTLAVLMLVLAWRTGRAVFVYATGVAMGLCVYTFLSGLLILPIIAVLLLVIFFRRPTWKQVFAGALMFAAFALVVAPAFLTTPPEHVLNMALGNAVARQEVIKDPAWVARVGLADSTLSFWYNDAWRHHYVAGPLVDAITGVLLAVGLSIALFRLRKRAERLMFTWFVGGLLLIGFTNYYNPGAHLTRLQLVMPAVALLAGLAAAKLHWALRFGLRINTPVIQTVVVTLLVVAAMLNLRQLLVDGPAILPRYSENMVMKTLQENPGYQVVEVGTSGTDEDATVIMLKPYPWLQDRFRYAPVSNFSGPFIETFGNTPTIFVTFNHDVADVLTPVLYPKYPVTREVFPPGESYMWLYKPVSPTKSHPPGN